MNIRNLIIMQQSLRELDQIENMIQFVKDGGFWTQDALKSYAEKHNKHDYGLIYITRFPDGAEMIHDGHHRTVATYLAGRYILREDEYLICNWTYDAYNDIWFDRGYVTPHDPRTEVRLSNFKAFKEKAIMLSKQNEAQAKQFVLDNRHLFMEPRVMRTVEELTEAYLESKVLVA